MLSFKLTFSLSSCTFMKMLFNSSLSAHKGSVIRVTEDINISPGNLDSSLCFIQLCISHLMCSAYKLNKQSDNIQFWHIPFPIWKPSVVPRLVLTVVSWHAYRFLRRQVRWSGVPIPWRIFHNFQHKEHTFCCDPHSQMLWHSQ